MGPPDGWCYEGAHTACLFFYPLLSIILSFLFDYLLFFFFPKKHYRPTPNAPDFTPTPHLKMTNSHPTSRCGAISCPSHSAAAVPSLKKAKPTRHGRRRRWRDVREELEPIIQVTVKTRRVGSTFGRKDEDRMLLFLDSPFQILRYPNQAHFLQSTPSAWAFPQRSRFLYVPNTIHTYP